MKIVFMAFYVYFYGVYAELFDYRFNRLIRKSLADSVPLTSAQLVSLSRKCYLRKLKFSNISEKLNLEIAKKQSL